VFVGPPFTAVSASGTHTCAIRTSRTVVCWGQNSDGESSPPSGTFKAIGAGAQHTCAIRTDDTCRYLQGPQRGLLLQLRHRNGQHRRLLGHQLQRPVHAADPLTGALACSSSVSGKHRSVGVHNFYGTVALKSSMVSCNHPDDIVGFHTKEDRTADGCTHLTRHEGGCGTQMHSVSPCASRRERIHARRVRRRVPVARCGWSSRCWRLSRSRVGRDAEARHAEGRLPPPRDDAGAGHATRPRFVRRR
jgi:hypothetical protein